MSLWRGMCGSSISTKRWRHYGRAARRSCNKPCPYVMREYIRRYIAMKHIRAARCSYTSRIHRLTFNKLLISQPQLKSSVLYGFVVSEKGKAIYRSVEYQLNSLTSRDAIINLSTDQSTNFISHTHRTRNKLVSRVQYRYRTDMEVVWCWYHIESIFIERVPTTLCEC